MYLTTPISLDHARGVSTKHHFPGHPVHYGVNVKAELPKNSSSMKLRNSNRQPIKKRLMFLPGYGPIAITDWSIIVQCHMLVKHGF
jgi:hypothetical protein